jgi:hypothetical protein
MTWFLTDGELPLQFNQHGDWPAIHPLVQSWPDTPSLVHLCNIGSLLQAYRNKEADFGAKQSEYAAVTAERDEVSQGLPVMACLQHSVYTAILHSFCLDLACGCTSDQH